MLALDIDYTDDIALLANTPIQAESLLQCLEQAAGSIGLHVNAGKIEYMGFNQKGDIVTLNGGSLKLVEKFTYLRSSVSTTENDIKMQLVKAWAAINRLLIIWKSKSDKIKGNGSTTWTLTKCIEKKLDRNYTRMLWTTWNKSWKQHPTKQQLYGHLPPISKTIQIRWTRHAGHYWRSKDELISNILWWTP